MGEKRKFSDGKTFGRPKFRKFFGPKVLVPNVIKHIRQPLVEHSLILETYYYCTKEATRLNADDI